MKRSTAAIACLTGAAFVFLGASPATADWSGTVGTAGIDTGVTSLILDRAKSGLDLQTGAPDNRKFEYASMTTCPNNFIGGPKVDLPCQGAIQACAGNTPAQGQGPQVQFFRRQVDAKNAPMQPAWDKLGTTCFPQLVPSATVLGLGRILDAFHNTAWAKPIVHIQPEGNTTLVTLPTYFQVKWPAEGFKPGEIDSINLMGFQVQIRPTNQGYTYVFGDGTSLSTASAGGVYPDGEITHTYSKANQYSSHIDITYGGEYRVSGGPWFTIDPIENVVITGLPQVVTVRTAHARLVIQ